MDYEGVGGCPIKTDNCQTFKRKKKKWIKGLKNRNIPGRNVQIKDS